MMRKEKIKIFCKVAIEEARKRHTIKIEIMKIMDEHVHMIANLPRTMSDAQALQIIKGLSSYILFKLCPCEKDILKDIFGMRDIFVKDAEAIFRECSNMLRIRKGTMISRKIKGRRPPLASGFFVAAKNL